MWLSILILVCLVIVARGQQQQQPQHPMQPQNPLIAHVTMPLVDCLLFASPAADVDASGGCVNALYVQWLAAAGVRTVPVVWNAPWDQARDVLDKTNGVMLPGGDLTGQDWLWYRNNVSRIIRYALDRNQAGDSFLLWGTCQGFQVMATVFAQDDTILRCIYHGVGAVMLPLNLTSFATSGRCSMFPSSDIQSLFSQYPVTLNLHHCGVDPKVWKESPLLSQAVQISAFNVDTLGQPFASAFESQHANVFGVQFHPERPQFQFDYAAIGHTKYDIAASVFMAEFVRQRLQMCTAHTYATPDDANAALIDNYPLTRLGWGKGYYWVGTGSDRMSLETAGGHGGGGGGGYAAWIIIVLFALTMVAAVRNYRGNS